MDLFLFFAFSGLSIIFNQWMLDIEQIFKNDHSLSHHILGQESRAWFSSSGDPPAYLFTLLQMY